VRAVQPKVPAEITEGGRDGGRGDTAPDHPIGHRGRGLEVGGKQHRVRRGRQRSSRRETADAGDDLLACLIDCRPVCPGQSGQQSPRVPHAPPIEIQEGGGVVGEGSAGHHDDTRGRPQRHSARGLARRRFRDIDNSGTTRMPGHD